MRLVQKSLLHTGYFIMDNNEVIPTFTHDLLKEALMHPHSKSIKSMYGVMRPDEILYLRDIVIKFKRKYGVLPQNFTEMLRTGFSSAGGLKQSHDLFKYK